MDGCGPRTGSRVDLHPRRAAGCQRRAGRTAAGPEPGPGLSPDPGPGLGFDPGPDPPRQAAARRGVTLDSVGGWLPPFLRVLAPWVLVLAGRRVCLLAQRVPALVRLGRLVVRVRERRRAGRETL